MQRFSGISENDELGRGYLLRGDLTKGMTGCEIPQAAKGRDLSPRGDRANKLAPKRPTCRGMIGVRVWSQQQGLPAPTQHFAFGKLSRGRLRVRGIL